MSSSPASLFPARISLAVALSVLSSLPLTSGYSWTFSSPPSQCQDLTINISGDGKPPYRALLVPFGPTPLANNIEARKILDLPFEGNTKTLSFKLAFPANSQFVTVVSDASGFGSGGTSVAAQVTSSNDGSCFDPSKNVAPLYFYNLEPANQIVQCQNTRIWWDPATVTGDTNFQGVIPGGQSFAIARSAISQVQGQGTGFNWKPSVRASTTLLLVGGDGRGNGTSGSTLNVVSAGIAPDQSCLDSNSPSSTPGQPAGGSYPTDKSGSGTGGGGGGGGKSNTGAIVGGIVGGIAAFILALLAFWFWKRKQKKARKVKERPDLLHADDDDDDDERRRRGTRPNELPQYYQPEPFLVPDPTVGRPSHDGTVLSGSNDERRPLSDGTFGDSFYTRATTPDGTGAGDHYSAGASSANGGRRKGGAPKPMRPVNIIQHDDAGPSAAPPPADEAETIELPPAYTALNKRQAGGEGVSEGETGRGVKAGRETEGLRAAPGAAPGGSSSGAGGSSSAAA